MPNYVEPINPEKTAVLVVNMSNGFVTPGAFNYVKSGCEFAPKLKGFLQTCRSKGLPVIYTVRAYRSDGSDLQDNNRRCSWSDQGRAFREGSWDSEVCEICRPADDEVVLKTHHYNAFYNTDLNVILQAGGIDTVIITGVCSDVSCYFTAREAFYLNYRVLFPEDLNGTRSWPDFGYGAVSEKEQHLAAINSLAATCAQVMSSEDICRCLK